MPAAKRVASEERELIDYLVKARRRWLERIMERAARQYRPKLRDYSGPPPYPWSEIEQRMRDLLDATQELADASKEIAIREGGNRGEAELDAMRRDERLFERLQRSRRALPKLEEGEVEWGRAVETYEIALRALHATEPYDMAWLDKMTEAWASTLLPEPQEAVRDRFLRPLRQAGGRKSKRLPLVWQRVTEIVTENPKITARAAWSTFLAAGHPDDVYFDGDKLVEYDPRGLERAICFETFRQYLRHAKRSVVTK